MELHIATSPGQDFSRQHTEIYGPSFTLWSTAPIERPKTTSTTSMTSEAGGAAPASSPIEQAVQTTTPVTHSGILPDSSALNPSANPPQYPTNRVVSLSRDLRPLQGRGSGIETSSALPLAQCVGDEIASILESAAVSSAPVQEVISTANPVVSRSARPSQAQHRVNELHIPSGFDYPDTNQDATVVRSCVTNVENGSKQISNADEF
jgi:hypothetical protein